MANINNKAGLVKLTDFTEALNRLICTASAGTVDGYIDIAEMFLKGRTFTGQAHGGYYTKTFTASATFNANDGNNQTMTCTGDTTLAISNELPGIYVFDLPISGSGVSSITIGATFGTPYDSNDSLAYTDGSQNTITLFVNANGTKKYTITSITA